MPEKPISRSSSEAADTTWGSALVLLAAWWLCMPLLMALVVGGGRLLFGGFGIRQQSIWQAVDRDMLHLNGWMDIWFAVGLFGTATFIGLMNTTGRLRHAGRVMTASIVAGLICLGFASADGLYLNNKDTGRYYGSATTFDIQPKSSPTDLRDLLKGAKASNKPGCTLVGAADVPSCILETSTSLADYDFAPRTSSFAAAQYVINAQGSVASGVDLIADSVHYLPGSATEPARWSGILDGSGYQNPTQGIMEWDGQSSTATSCKFNTTDDQFNRAFGGERSNDLTNYIAERYPNFWFDQKDMFGFCRKVGSESRPVIVLPVTRQHFYGSRSVVMPAGVLELTGSSNGAPHITYYQTVKAGQYPGPVYPQSIVTKQVDATAWAAGHGNHDRGNFGFQRTNVESNALNPGEYILRSQHDGHLYAVTPLTPNSKSQAVVAYAVEQVDQVGAGLNGLSVIVPSDVTNPPSMTTLESNMVASVGTADPTVLNSGNGGKLQEIVPFGNGMWRGIVDVKGLSVAYIDVPSDVHKGVQLSYVDSQNGINTTVTFGVAPGSSNQANPTAPGGPTTPTAPANGGSTGTLVCTPPESLTTSQALACAQYYLGLAQTKNGAQPSASPTTPVPSATHS